MRIFFKDVSGIKEITQQLSRFGADTYLITLTSSNYIYIASDFPMNHFYIKLGDQKNAASASMQVDYWTSTNWAPVVNLNDYTDGLSHSGFVDFTPNKDVSWLRSDTDGASGIIGLENITVYDKYWTRIKFTGTLTPQIEFNYLGYKFSDDVDLFSEYPVFNDQNFLSGFEVGKTTWEEQHVKAADLIIQDMKRKGIIIGKEQILDRDVLLPASVCKVAEILFNAFGRDYIDDAKKARYEYDKRMDLSAFLVDQNNNGVLDEVDVGYRQGWLSR